MDRQRARTLEPTRTEPRGCLLGLGRHAAALNVVSSRSQAGPLVVGKRPVAIGFVLRSRERRTL